MTKRVNRPITKKAGERILILCEGETEEDYFIGYKTHDSNRRRLTSINVEIYKPKDHSPLGLISEAKMRIRQARRDGNPYYKVFCVFDKDGHANIARSFNDAREARIDLLFSALCFEV